MSFWGAEACGLANSDRPKERDEVRAFRGVEFKSEDVSGLRTLRVEHRGQASATVLFVLFVAQWFFPSPAARYIFSAIYLLLVLGVGLSTSQRRRDFSRLFRVGPLS